MNHQYMNVDDRTSASQPYPGDNFHLGSTHSSPNSFDDMGHPVTWSQHMPPPLPTGAASMSGANGVQQNKANLPIQKRRRVTRACDECRRKKIKCDGKQPCTHCTVYSYECTYDQPSNRRRNPAPQYIEALEQKLQRTEAIIRTYLPDVDINFPDFDVAKLQSAMAAHQKTPSESSLHSNISKEDKESLLDSMVESTGRLDIDETGHVDFHGHSSGLTYLTHLNQFGNFLGEVKMGSVSWPVAKAGPVLPPHGSPQSVSHSPQSENISDVTLLPPKETATFLVKTCLDKACVLMRFIHRPSFVARAERLYEIRPEDYDEEDNTFLPLFYVALGVGCLFVDEGEISVENTASEAMKYFNAGRRMIEMTDIRDIYSLQAVLLMTIYLQSSTRMSTCYSYVGIALSAAVRMGLHRAIPEARFNCIEREVRKRIFWTCWKMDTYVGAILGLPKGIAPEDIDQEYPAEVDDENITRDEIIPQAEGTISTMAAANAHTKLLHIMAKTVKYIYPLKGVEASVSAGGSGYSVSQVKLHEIEVDLQKWWDALPSVLKPESEDSPANFQKCQYLLKMSHLHVQMMLYRPFVHYISYQKQKGCDKHSYGIATACVDVARKIIHTTEQMQKHGLLNGAYWFTIYTTFFSIITLVYYVMAGPPDHNTREIQKTAEVGLECLNSIKDRSMAAKRCIIALESPFHAMAERAKNAPIPPIPQKKRSRANSRAGPDDDDNQSSTPTSRASPGTISPSGAKSRSAAHSPALPTKSSPTTNHHHHRNRHSQSPHHSSNYSTSASSTPQSLTRRSSYETPKTDFTTNGVKQERNNTEHMSQQRAMYQAHLSGSGLPDLNSMMFSPPDMFSFPLMDPAVQQYNQQQKQSTPAYQNMPPFGNHLEGNVLGPIPPYLLQGSSQNMNDSSMDDPSDNVQNENSNGVQGGMMNGGFYPGSGRPAGPIVADFFGDGWDDTIMQNEFRSS